MRVDSNLSICRWMAFLTVSERLTRCGIMTPRSRNSLSSSALTRVLSFGSDSSLDCKREIMSSLDDWFAVDFAFWTSFQSWSTKLPRLLILVIPLSFLCRHSLSVIPWLSYVSWKHRGSLREDYACGSTLFAFDSIGSNIWGSLTNSVTGVAAWKGPLYCILWYDLGWFSKDCLGRGASSMTGP